MSWEKVKISDFLKVRNEKFNPDDKTISGLKRIDKIDFSGNIYLSDKISNTEMILIKKGDLVISGINVSKGAMAVYQGDNDVLATIHYSSYKFDKNKIDIEFLKLFLKSSEFIKVLKEQVQGGIKTEIKPKHFLSLVIKLPTTLIEQKNIVKKLDLQLFHVDKLTFEQLKQLDLINKIRQQILNNAIQGKLTIKWREQNPNIEPATELLKRIKTEKEQLIKEKKIKRDKPLSPILKNEISFELPQGWVWCRLGEICNYGNSPKAESKDINDETWVLDLEDIEKQSSKLLNKIRFFERKSLSTKSVFKKGEVLYSKLRPYLDKVIVADEDGVCTTEILPLKTYGGINPYFLKFTLKRNDFLLYVNSVTKGMKMPRLGTKEGKLAKIPLPPLHEQQAIVTKLEALLEKCNQLQDEIENMNKYSKELLKALFNETFGGS